MFIEIKAGQVAINIRQYNFIYIREPKSNPNVVYKKLSAFI